MFNVQCSAFSVQSAVRSVQYAVCSMQCACRECRVSGLSGRHGEECHISVCTGESRHCTLDVNIIQKLEYSTSVALTIFGSDASLRFCMAAVLTVRTALWGMVTVAVHRTQCHALEESSLRISPRFTSALCHVLPRSDDTSTFDT